MKNVEHVPQVPSLVCKAYTEPCRLMCLVKLPIKHELNMLKNTTCCKWCEMINKLLPTRMSLDSATNKYINNAYQTRSGIWHPYKGHLLRTPPFLLHILCIYIYGLCIFMHRITVIKKIKINQQWYSQVWKLWWHLISGDVIISLKIQLIRNLYKKLQTMQQRTPLVKEQLAHQYPVTNVFTMNVSLDWMSPSFLVSYK